MLFAASIVISLLVGGAVGALVTHATIDRTPAASSGAPPTTTASTTAPAGSTPTDPSRAGRPPSTTTSTAPPVLSVVSVTPAAGEVGVGAGSPITVTFSAPLAPGSPLPTIAPTTAGSWRASGAALTFTPVTPFTPLSEVSLEVRGGPTGVVGADTAHLARSVVETFRIANGSTIRLQQLLSLLKYSPLAWTPTGAPLGPTDSAAQIAALYHPPAGTFSWIDAGWPARLTALWEPGLDNVFTAGLIMSFQADHGLTPNGQITPGLWSALVAALAANTVNTGGYNYAFASKVAPESLTVYHDGSVVMRTPANTGIAGSPTPDGTFPVYTRLRRQVMRGTNPDGQHYADLVQYIAYFHGNDAVHYMDRADYGIPQSLGCIELPLADAARVWPYLAYGTLVTVVG